MNRIIIRWIIIRCLFSPCLCPFTAQAGKGRDILGIDILKCEYRINPLGIDEANPHLSWTFETNRRNQYQSAYRILVSTSEEALNRNNGEVWDSGKIPSAENIFISFAGKALHSFTRYYWKVRAWNRQNEPTGWSRVSWFETAFLDTPAWRGRWIRDAKPDPVTEEDAYTERPAPLFRKTFPITKTIKTARLYISGLGYYEAYLNGDKIGDRVLDPGWTNYGKTVLYSVYDLTAQLHPGTNALGVLLGNGWYNPLPMRLFGAFDLRKTLTVGRPAFIADLRVVYMDGTVETIATDSSWKTSGSSILKNNIYLGEIQDGRLEQKDWALPSFSDENWGAVLPSAPPAGKLTAQAVPPVRVTREIKPILISEPEKNIYVVDLGQNFAGWIQMKIEGLAGQAVHFRYGELIFPDGRVNGLTTVAGHIKEIWHVNGGPGSPKTAYQEDGYTCRGDGTDFFQPHFTFHAFRYVEITGLTQKPVLNSFHGERLNSDVPEAGHFICSNDLFNQIQQNTLFSFLSNLFSVQSDCPGRERQGYGADMVTSCEAYLYNFDMSCFYTKAVMDFANDARPNGGMPECAPYNGIATEGFAEGAGPIGWQLAFPYLQEQLYRFYGNKKILETNYPSTKKLVEFLKTQAKDNLIDHGIGDHVSIDEKHVPLTSGAFYFHHVRLLAEFARILGNREDARRYGELADRISRSFNRRYLHTGTGIYDTSYNAITQVFPLWYGLTPMGERRKAFGALLEQILQKHQGHLSTGIFGTKMMFDVLRRYDQDSVAALITNQTDYPGYGYMIRNGATTLWETWDKPDQNSWNHPMFGSVSEWFYRSLLGINPADNAAGMDKIVIKPYTGAGAGLTFARGYYSSIRGKIVSEWKRKDGIFTWAVEIPANVKARIYIPARSVHEISESKLPVLQIKELRYVKQEGSYSVFEALSGSYHFKVSREP
jgi:alpha-L-rhamnosidase